MSCAGPGAWYLKEGLLEGKILFSLKISSENNHTMKLKNINASYVSIHCQADNPPNYKMPQMSLSLGTVWYTAIIGTLGRWRQD